MSQHLGSGPGPRRCLAIGHRGASEEAPENTLVAFARAVERGADMVELDVQVTADGALVVIHDEDVRRTTDGRGPVRQMTLAELAQLDAGSWFAAEFRGERIPTFAETCAFAAGRVRLNVEVKNPLADFVSVAPSFLSCLDRFGLLSSTIVSSFDLAVLSHLRRISSRVHLAFLCRTFLGPLALRELDGLDAVALHPHHALLTVRRLERLHQRGLAVHAWTVDSPHRMAKLLEWGVDGIITNSLPPLRRLIDDRK